MLSSQLRLRLSSRVLRLMSRDSFASVVNDPGNDPPVSSRLPLPSERRWKNQQFILFFIFFSCCHCNHGVTELYYYLTLSKQVYAPAINPYAGGG